MERPTKGSAKGCSIESDLAAGGLAALQASLFFLTAESLFEAVIDVREALQQSVANLRQSDMAPRK